MNVLLSGYTPGRLKITIASYGSPDAIICVTQAPFISLTALWTIGWHRPGWDKRAMWQASWCDHRRFGLLLPWTPRYGRLPTTMTSKGDQSLGSLHDHIISSAYAFTYTRLYNSPGSTHFGISTCWSPHKIEAKQEYANSGYMPLITNTSFCHAWQANISPIVNQYGTWTAPTLTLLLNVGDIRSWTMIKRCTQRRERWNENYFGIKSDITL
jgi:hypothetical protein